MSDIIVNIFDAFLGTPKKTNFSKGQVAYDCPCCSNEKGMSQGDGKGNLEVNYEMGVFNCWACGSRNNMRGPASFLIKRFGTKELLRQYNLLKPEETYVEHDIRYVDKLPSEFIKFSEGKNTYIKRLGLEYLKRRNVTDDLIKQYNIGYAEEGDYENRILIPSYGPSGDINFFSNRSIETATGYCKAFPKYLNPEADKDVIIFNEKLISWNAPIYLVEGAFDHIVVPNSIPLLGKTLSEYLMFMLYNYSKNTIIIFLDGDAYDNAKMIYRELNFGKLSNRIKIIKVNDGYDASKINEDFGRNGLLKVLRTARKLSDKELWQETIGQNIRF